MACDDDLERDGLGHLNDNGCHFLGYLGAAHNPLEFASHTVPLGIVSDFGSHGRAQVLNDRAVHLVQGETEVSVGDAIER